MITYVSHVYTSYVIKMQKRAELQNHGSDGKDPTAREMKYRFNICVACVLINF